MPKERVNSEPRKEDIKKADEEAARAAQLAEEWRAPYMDQWLRSQQSHEGNQHNYRSIVGPRGSMQEELGCDQTQSPSTPEVAGDGGAGEVEHPQLIAHPANRQSPVSAGGQPSEASADPAGSSGQGSVTRGASGTGGGGDRKEN